MATFPQTHFEKLVHSSIGESFFLNPHVQNLLKTPYHEPYPGWREVTESGFVRGGFFTFRIKAMQTKTITLPNSKGPLTARAFLFGDGTGYALVQDYWGGKLRYFTFGCDHDMTITNIGRCLNRHTCKICGYTTDIDSSD